MLCPICNGPTRVAETRIADSGRSLRRRRVCLECGARRTTYERYDAPRPVVVKRDGERQPFDRSKLRAALLRSTHKRPVDGGRVEALVERIETEASAGNSAAGGPGAGARGEIGAARISELALAGLAELDRGAFLQFAGTLPDPLPEIAGSNAPAGAVSKRSVRAARKSSESVL